MKKIFFLLAFLILTLPLIAQNTHQPNKVMSSQAIDNKIFDTTGVAIRIIIVDANGKLISFSDPIPTSNVPGYRDTTLTVVIDSAASISGAINLGNRRLKGIQVPTGWGSNAPLSFQNSFDDGTTYQNYYVDDAEHSMSATAATNINCNPRTWVGVSYLKIRSGTSSSPVVQSGAASTRTLKLRIGNY